MKIALTYTGSDEKHNNYVQWLKDAADSAEKIHVIKISANDNNLQEMLNCNALVLSGGRDIHPKAYENKNTDYPNSPNNFDEQRDEFEIAAFKLAQAQNLPVLGICRGMQLVNCILGGTLKQDLGVTLNLIHRSEANIDKVHGLNIENNTIVNEITKTKRSIVNSAHHQAIEKLGEGLKVSCTADDDTIEGFEWADPSGKSFFLCIQWHPERMFKFQLSDSPLSKNIRNKFIEEIKKSKQINENH
ncbi:MAG: gamma-glutamyl-gamma-aminobutyrate hydrolase family protein [Bacteroidota bacterium]|nr:gamma-glutamyl-gamma-aminobutyrate hydrolase family protein [Bacteroidota bacterium]